MYHSEFERYGNYLYKLAVDYDTKGYKHSRRRAIYYYQRAALLGNSIALQKIGVYFSNNPNTYFTALYCFVSAAPQVPSKRMRRLLIARFSRLPIDPDLQSQFLELLSQTSKQRTLAFLQCLAYKSSDLSPLYNHSIFELGFITYILSFMGNTGMIIDDNLLIDSCAGISEMLEDRLVETISFTAPLVRYLTEMKEFDVVAFVFIIMSVIVVVFPIDSMMGII